MYSCSMADWLYVLDWFKDITIWLELELHTPSSCDSLRKSREKEKRLIKGLLEMMFNLESQFFYV